LKHKKQGEAMQRQFILLVICTGAVACSSTPPTAVSPDTGQAATAKAANQAMNGDPSSEEHVSTSTDDAEVIPVADVPTVPQVNHEGDKNDIICQRVKPTGSHRARRVCRTRAEIERSAIEGKKTINEMERVQRIETGN
jgi:hypothetical protein